MNVSPFVLAGPKRFSWSQLRLQYDKGRSAIVTDPINAVFDSDLNQPWWHGQISETHTFNSSAANQFLLAGSYFAFIIQANHPAQPPATFPTTLNFFASGMPFNWLGGGDNWNVYGTGRYHTKYQLSEDFVKTRGKHKFGIGGQFARVY